LRYYLIIVVLLVIAEGVSAQDVQYLRGRILTSDSLLPMSNVHIISKKARRGTISNPEGNFIVRSMADDSLMLTSIGFVSKIVRITDAMIHSTDTLTFLMRKDTVRMDEVIVRSFYEWETFKYLFVNMKPIDPVSIEWLNIELERSLTEVRQRPITIKGPIQAMYDLFNHTARIQRRLERNRRWYNQQVIREGRPQDTIPALPPHLRNYE
jgi:glutaredoxin-related protein